MSSHYEQMFRRLGREGRGAFIPFVTIGDPTPADSLEIIRTLVEAGADALELGIAFSDPVADGPTIQAANNRALKSGLTPKASLRMISQIRAGFPEIPIGLLVYANLVISNGIGAFYDAAGNAGVDSVLVADVPMHESAPFREAALRHYIAPVQIAPPNADDALLAEIATHCEGYVYVVSREGVTGAEREATRPLRNIVSKLSELNAPPALVGFGISRPEHVKMALDSGARGAIVGSAIVSIVAEMHADHDAMLVEIASFVKEMKAAT